MFCKALHAHLEDKVRRNLPNALIVASQLLFNLQSVARAPMVAEQHYNTDNAMFARMLGPYDELQLRVLEGCRDAG